MASGSTGSSNVVGVHYRVGKKIGEGSFGVIFEGTNLLNQQQVAIKFEPRKSDAPQLRDEYRTYKILVGCRKSSFPISFRRPSRRSPSWACGRLWHAADAHYTGYGHAKKLVLGVLSQMCGHGPQCCFRDEHEVPRMF